MKEDVVIVFDVDGTLFDTKPGILKAINEVLNSFGENSIVPAEEDKWIGPSVRDSFKLFCNMPDEKAEIATLLYRQIYTKKYVSESNLYKDIDRILVDFKTRGYHLCIATLKTAEQIERLLFIKKFSNFFEVVKTALPDGSKSKTDMLNEIRKMFPKSKYFYMIGDTQSDLEAAEKTNYFFVGACYGYGSFSSKANLIRIDNCIQLLSIIKPEPTP